METFARIIAYIFGFFFVFSALMFLNQVFFYNACFQSHCIDNAIPKILVFSTIVLGLIVFFLNQKNAPVNWEKDVDQQSVPNAPIKSAENIRLVATTDITTKHFDSFKAAAQYAKEMQADGYSDIVVRREGRLFNVEGKGNRRITQAKLNLTPAAQIDSALLQSAGVSTTRVLQPIKTYIDDESEEDDRLEFYEELEYELNEYSESLARSEEDGWFYSDNDSGPESIVDPSTLQKES